MFINSDKLILNVPDNFNKEKYKKILLSQKIQTITEHLKQHIIEKSNEEILPVIDPNKPQISTLDMKP